jgi:hypothetical protein
MNSREDNDIFSTYADRTVSKRKISTQEDVYIRIEEHFEETIGGEVESLAKVYESDINKLAHWWSVSTPLRRRTDLEPWGLATSMKPEAEYNKVTLFYIKHEYFSDFLESDTGYSHRMGLRDYIEQHGIDIDKMPVKNPDDGPVDSDLVNFHY